MDVANIVSQRRMERIRAYYGSLVPSAPPYFVADDSVAGNHGVQYGRWSFLFHHGQHGHRGQLRAGRRHDRAAVRPGRQGAAAGCRGRRCGGRPGPARRKPAL